MTPNTPLIVVCPCCGKEAYLEMQESESEEIRYRLFHYTSEISYAEIQAQGFEFGSIEGGEIINGENANISVQQNN